MNNRAEIKRAFKEQKALLGIYRITNYINGKMFVGKSRNLHATMNGDQFMLKFGSHQNKKLQQDWNAFGAENFTFEIVETLKRREDVPPTYVYKEELRDLEQKWLDEWQPFGDKGYND